MVNERRTLVTKAARPLLIKEGRDELNDNDITRVANVEGDIGHDGNEHVLLASELARVDERWEPISPELAKRIGNKLGDDLIDVDRWLTEREQLVDQCTKASEEKADSPGADGIDGLAGVISRGDDGADFNIRRVIDDEGGFHLDFFEQALIVDGILLDVGVLGEVAGENEYARGEEGI